MPQDSVALNKEQKQAVDFGKGPLLVIAGAGTGKTTVITERVKKLVVKDGVSPSEILALTFTNKAAFEMEERVDMALPMGFTQTWIMTFHSFCEQVLREQAIHVGLDGGFDSMGTAETINLIKTNLFQFDLDYFRPLGNPTKFVWGLVEHFSRLQDEDISPAKYLSWARGQIKKSNGKSKEEKLEAAKWLELASAYKKYSQIKIKEGKMDYGDLITNTLTLFRKRPNVLASYQKKFKYILVDEFQDTNIAQNELVKLLAGKKQNLMVVADDDQSIYKWRGAAVSNVIDFRKSFPKTKVVTLIQNYRSTQEILDRAYDLITNNNPDRLEVKERVDKKLKSAQKDAGETIEFVHEKNADNEAEKTALIIKKLVEKEKHSFSDIAILVRANNHADPFVHALNRLSIPVSFLGPEKLFNQPEVADLISYLKVLADPTDSVSVHRVLAMDCWGISPLYLARLNQEAKKNHKNLLEVVEEKKQDEKLQKAMIMIEKHLRETKNKSAGQLLYDFLEETGLVRQLVKAGDQEAEKKVVNISRFFDRIKSLETNSKSSVADTVSWLDLMLQVGESPRAAEAEFGADDVVKIMTVHSAKGLEFPVVFIANLVAHRFPSMNRREQIPIPDELVKETLPEGDYHLQEERRLFYVAMTRAQKKLFFMAADFYGQAKRQTRLSPFIFEALGDQLVTSERKTQNKKSQKISLAKKKTVARKPTPKVHVDYLSYSQIETFQTCPLHYKLRYVLNVPMPPAAATSFGTSVHEALKLFYKQVPQLKKPTGYTKLVSNCLSQVWQSEGYLTKSHEELIYKKGRDLLVDYVKKEFDPKKLPIALEESFTVPMNGFRIGGRIDRVDKIRGGIEIVDYKTGTPPDEKNAQKHADQSMQLTFYALAATKVAEKPFGQKPENVKLSLYYLENQTKITTTRTVKQLKEAQKEITAIKKEIEKSNFACSGHFFCKSCEYLSFCSEER